MGGQSYDGCIAIPGCDKNMPGCAIGLARINRPSLMIYGGTISPGKTSKGEKVDVVSAFQAYGQVLLGQQTVKAKRSGREWIDV